MTLLDLQLRRQTAQPGFIGIVRHPERQLNPEFFCQLPLQRVRFDYRALIFISSSQADSQFVLRQALHADQEATLITLAAGPSGNQIVDRLPSTKIEIPNAEVPRR